MEHEWTCGAVPAQDMLWCQEYAWHNRSFMRDLMIDIVEDVTKGSVSLDESVNIHHNFCQCERCNYTVRQNPSTLLSWLCHAGFGLFFGSSAFCSLSLNWWRRAQDREGWKAVMNTLLRGT